MGRDKPKQTGLFRAPACRIRSSTAIPRLGSASRPRCRPRSGRVYRELMRAAGAARVLRSVSGTEFSAVRRTTLEGGAVSDRRCADGLAVTDNFADDCREPMRSWRSVSRRAAGNLQGKRAPSRYSCPSAPPITRAGATERSLHDFLRRSSSASPGLPENPIRLRIQRLRYASKGRPAPLLKPELSGQEDWQRSGKEMRRRRNAAIKQPTKGGPRPGGCCRAFQGL